jgi:hypothetical protein
MKMRLRGIAFGWGLLWALVALADPLPEEEKSELPAPASSEPAFAEVLEKAEKFLARQKHVHVISDYGWESGIEGKKDSGRKRIEGWLVRPGQFRLTITRENVPQADLVVVGDGKSAYTYLPAPGIFSSAPLVGPKAGLERNVIVSQALVGSGLEMTWRPDMARFVITQAQNILDRGIEKNGDVEGRHFSFSFGDVRLQVWFTPGDEPILKRVKRSTKLATAGNPEPFELDIVSDLTWDFQVPKDENLFRFSRTPGARRVADLYAALAGEDPAAPAPSIKEIRFLSNENKEILLPTDRRLILLVGLAWDETTLPLLKKLKEDLGRLGKKDWTTGAIIIGDEVADLAPFVSAAGGMVWLDRIGALPTALGDDALPVLVTWDGSSVTSHGPVTESSLSEMVSRTTNSPAPKE